MDILPWTDETNAKVLVGGWLTEERNWKSVETAQGQGALAVEKGEDFSCSRSQRRATRSRPDFALLSPGLCAMSFVAAVRLPEFDALCLWLARFPIQNNQPRTLMLPKRGDESVLLVRSDDLLVNVFERLTEDGFLGCPVVDVDKQYLGQVDILDIVFYVCSLFKARQLTRSDNSRTKRRCWLACNAISSQSKVCCLLSSRVQR
jgi:hypothetical protein